MIMRESVVSSEKVSFTAEREKSPKIRICSNRIKGSIKLFQRLQVVPAPSICPNAFNPIRRLRTIRNPTPSSQSDVFRLSNPAPHLHSIAAPSLRLRRPQSILAPYLRSNAFTQAPFLSFRRLLSDLASSD